MKPFVFSFACLALVAGGISLSTRYETDHAMRVEVTTSMSTETEMTMERDGKPDDSHGGMGGSSEAEFKEVHIDHVMAAEKGKPSKVKRSFESLGGSRSMTFGEQSRDSDIESPIEGVTVMLSGEDGSVTAEVVEGTKPENDDAFKHEHLGLFLDGVLPAREVEDGATWDLSKEQVLSILRLDSHGGLFPPPPRDGGERGDGGGGGRRGGGRMGGPGGGDLRLLLDADWKGTAKVTSIDEEVGGVKCAVIELDLKASGELPMPEMRGGPRERMVSPEFASIAGNSYDIALEGKLVFDLAAKHPVSLDVSGSVSNTTDMEREGRDGGTFKVHTKRDGKYKLAVKVTAEKVETK